MCLTAFQSDDLFKFLVNQLSLYLDRPTSRAHLVATPSTHQVAAPSHLDLLSTDTEPHTRADQLEYDQ